MSSAPRVDGATNRTSYVLDRMREDIATGVIKSGASIRQIEIAARYGVSATPVREALRLLEADGVVVYTAHRGATLREISLEDADDLSTLRAEIEGLATRVAVARIDTATIAELRVIHELLASELSNDAAPEVLAKLNKQFHFQIYNAGSRIIASQIQSLWSLSPPAESIWHNSTAASASTRDHDSIIHAIEAGESDAARSLMSAHIFRAAKLARSTTAQSFAEAAGGHQLGGFFSA